MLAATDGLPVNFGFTGKGNDSGKIAMREIIRAGAALHEDWGTTPAAIKAGADELSPGLTVTRMSTVRCHVGVKPWPPVCLAGESWMIWCWHTPLGC